DSVLIEWDKTDVDSVGFVSITNDSSYVFPLTNYQSSLLETSTAGDNQQVSEVVRLGDVKLLYRLKVDENTLRRRNVTARPTEYMKQQIDEERRNIARQLEAQQENEEADSTMQQDFFLNEFQDEEPEQESRVGEIVQGEEIVMTSVIKK